jgi:ABC-type antimicrobial peptide transport system permease subunit
MLALLSSISWRHVKRHRLRTALTFFGIALGVAVIVAIAIVNRSLTTSFESTIDQIAGKAVLQDRQRRERYRRIFVPGHS